MKKLLSLISTVLLLAGLAACAHRKLETTKMRYQKAQQAQEEGRDLEAILQWKEIVKETTKEIESGQVRSTSYFLRAAAWIELGKWDFAFMDLRQVQAEALSKEELWIYPLYLVLMGDYYARNGLFSVAENFYQSVLKQSRLKSSPVYLLALERHINAGIKSIDRNAGENPDPNRYRTKEYEALAKEVQKHIEDDPSSSVSHFLLADLLLKLGNANEALEHFMASLEMGLPTPDLKRTVEFEISTLLEGYSVSNHIKSTLLSRAMKWWGNDSKNSILIAGENTISWLSEQNVDPGAITDGMVRYLGIASGGKLKILVWEKQQGKEP